MSEGESEGESIMKRDNLACIVLAAGLGKRMKSKKIKVLHELCRKPIVCYTVKTLSELNPLILIAVVGHQKEHVSNALANFDIKFAYQKEQLGTGHATLQAEGILKNFSGDILIIPGDVPLITQNTLENFIKKHIENHWLLTVLTVDLKNPSGYGRVITDSKAQITKIVEEKDASEKEKQIKCINSGIYIVKSSFLWDACKNLNTDNKQKEFYLTDIAYMAKEQDRVGTFHVQNSEEALGVNTKEDLEKIENILKINRG